jgi:phosphoribosylaminoimidazole-succinocarboxamide synthase
LVDCNSDPSVAVGHLCAFQSRNGYSLRVWSCGREYALGKREICVPMPEGLKENDFITITPTTKADNGEHDADISRENILSKVSEEDYLVLEKYQRLISKR